LDRLVRVQKLGELLWYKALADLRAERDRTYLGFLWWFLEPAMLLAVFVVVFTGVFQQGRPGYVDDLMVGLVIWQFFQSLAQHPANSILQSVGILKNVKIHPGIFPLAVAIASSIKFLLVLVVLIAVLWARGHAPGASYIYLPYLLITMFLFGVALGSVVAAIVPFVPDLRFVIDPVLRALFFLSPVFYTVADAAPGLRPWLNMNPLTPFLESFRAVLLHGAAPDIAACAAWAAVAIGILAICYFATARIAPRYAKLPG
jgi:lipopolysaccharide transport system permease protein